MCGQRRPAAPASSLGSFGRASRGGGRGSSGDRALQPGLGDTMRRVLRLLLGCFLTELCARMCRAQERAGHGQLAQLGGVLLLTGGNRSGAASGEAGEGVGSSDAPPTRAPTPDSCRGYFDVMGQWDPPFNCSSGDFIFCCGTCGFRFCCTFKKRRLNQSTCTNYDTPLWLNTGKPPARKDDPLHDPTKDKTNLIVYIICGVVAVMVLVGIFTKLGLEKAHRPQREHMSRALADVMRPQGHCNTDHMERDLNIVVHVQHYENMDTRTPINNLRLQSSYLSLWCAKITVLCQYEELSASLTLMLVHPFHLGQMLQELTCCVEDQVVGRWLRRNWVGERGEGSRISQRYHEVRRQMKKGRGENDVSARKLADGTWCSSPEEAVEPLHAVHLDHSIVDRHYQMELLPRQSSLAHPLLILEEGGLPSPPAEEEAFLSVALFPLP
nr:protein shisa-9 [Meriones unguiculatus]